MIRNMKKICKKLKILINQIMWKKNLTFIANPQISQILYEYMNNEFQGRLQTASKIHVHIFHIMIDIKPYWKHP